MSHLSVFCLGPGAGQDVGRSCILVSIAGKNVMLDCGMHMGYNDDVSTAEEPERCVETPSRRVCLAFPSRAAGSSFRSAPFYPSAARLVSRGTWVILARCALPGACIGHCWSWVMERMTSCCPFKILPSCARGPSPSVSLVCEALPSSRPFPGSWTLEEHEAKCGCSIPGGFGLYFIWAGIFCASQHSSCR